MKYLQLAKISNSQPHAGFSALIYGLMNRRSFICRTVPDVQDILEKLELMLQEIFLPIVSGRLPLGPHDRKFFSLPARLGGLGISDFVYDAPHVYEESLRICSTVVEQIVSKSFKYDYECEYKQVIEKSAMSRERSKREKSKFSELMLSISQEDRLKLCLASEKGASSWLTVLPIREFGFALHRRNFIDALHLRYGWLPKDLPLFCACGSKFTVDHALSCLKGGFIHGRHNEIRNFTASLLTETCNDVVIEPTLQPIDDKDSLPSSSNVRDDARLDIGVNGFWGGWFERCFIDVRVFNPYAPSNKATDIKDTYRGHEKEKKLYERRILDKELHLLCWYFL